MPLRDIIDTKAKRLRPTRALAGAVVAMLWGCGSEPSTERPADPAGEALGTVQAPVYWEPTAALVTEHVNWHAQGQCGTGGRRRCSLPGEDFLIFHRNYLKRLRDDYRAKGLNETNAMTWDRLPPWMKSTANGWSANLQAQENNLLAFVRPNPNGAGTIPITTLNDYGLYLETFYHNALHGIAATGAVGSGCTSNTNDCVVRGAMSPKSTIFFQIHGLMERYFERFMNNSDFNRDGHADLYVRGWNGSNQIRLQNETTTTSTATLPNVALDSCTWYMGATADFNFDGWNDMVWHAPGCSRTALWFMNGTTYSSSVALTGVDNAWRLIGAGEFSWDAMPDLVWREPSTGRISIWKMNGTSILGDVTFSYPVAREISAIGDFNNDSNPDFLVRTWNSATADYSYHIQYMQATTQGPFVSLGLRINQYQHPVATGRYSRGNRWVDVLMRADQPVPSPRPYFHYFLLWDGAAFTSTPHQSTGIDLYVAGP